LLRVWIARARQDHFAEASDVASQAAE
jgi:hypothetical protein